MKWVRLSEGAYYLNTTTSNLMVAACQYRKRNSIYPKWYKSDGKLGANKSYVDIDYIQKLRAQEETIRNEACDLYFVITEDMGIIQSRLAPILAENSELYNKPKSWMSFFQKSLFSSFQMKFCDRVTRVQEFHRIAKQIVGEHNAKLDIAS